MSDNYTGFEIAVIGVAAQVPGAKNVEAYWDDLINGKECIARFTDSQLRLSGVSKELIENPNYVNAKGIIHEVEFFDGLFFGFNANEVNVLDPQTRIFFECVWQALEDAGYDPYTYKKSIGLYGGASNNLGWLAMTAQKDDTGVNPLYSKFLRNKDMLCSLVSYKLNLNGPVVSLSTACSTSLVAIHEACQALLSGECSIAIAGGVTVNLPNIAGYLYEEGLIVSPDGHVRAFDEKAQGTVYSDGAGAVILKPLEDALEDNDNIHAIIKGSAINNDGNQKIGFAAPSARGQMKVIRDAIKASDVAPESITFVETHGTGTPVGDPIEVEALSKAFNTEKREYCAIGSVKSNIGHLDAAAGVVGFIKAVLSLKHKMIPPSINFEKPNPLIDFANSPFYVNKTLKEWKSSDGPLRAGVSAFGVGGTNAHVILEEAPRREVSSEGLSKELLILSARTQASLDNMALQLADFIEEYPEVNFSDLCYTLQTGRAQFDLRVGIVCSGKADGISRLRTPLNPLLANKDRNKSVFMFAGEGSQYRDMGRGLYDKEPVFREELDKCFNYLKGRTLCDLKEIMYGGNSDNSGEVHITDSSVSEIITFIFEYALGRLFFRWGMKPDAMVGYGVGEYAAACLAGTFSLEDALDVLLLRTELIQSMAQVNMLEVALPEGKLSEYINSHLSVASLKSSDLSVLSGEAGAVEAAVKKLEAEGVEYKILPAASACQSRRMNQVVPRFLEKLQQIQLNKPEIPLLSNVTGAWIPKQELVKPEYWCKHLCETIRFNTALDELLSTGDYVFIEIGPGKTLNKLVEQHREYAHQRILINSVREEKQDVEDDTHLWQQISRIWCAGLKVDWEKVHKDSQRQKVSLPYYSFDRQAYWFEGDPYAILNGQKSGAPATSMGQKGTASEKEQQLYPRPVLESVYEEPETEVEIKLAGIWQSILGFAGIGVEDSFFELGGNSLDATIITNLIHKEFDIKISLGDVIRKFTIREQGRYIEDMQNEKYELQELEAILAEIEQNN